MRIVKALPVVASVLLLGSWIVQQFLYDRWNSKLAVIGASEAVFHTYQSANAVFRAMRAVSPDRSSQIEQQQERNFERGAQLVLLQLDPDIYARAMEKARHSLDRFRTLESLPIDERILIKFDAMQIALFDQRQSLGAYKAMAELSFLALYGTSSVLLLFAAVDKYRRGDFDQ